MSRSNWRYNETNDDDDDSSSTVESDTEYINSNDLVYSDDDDEDEEQKIETDYNIGNFYIDSVRPTKKKAFDFRTPTRFKEKVIATPVTTTTSNQKSSTTRYKLTDDDMDDENDDQNHDTINIQKFPPIQSYRNPKTASVSSLWALSMQQSPQPNKNNQMTVRNSNQNINSSINRTDIVVAPDIEDDIHRLTQLLQQVQMTSTETNTTTSIQQYQNTKRIYDLQKERQQIRREMEKIQHQFELQHQQAKDALLQLIQEQEQTANKIRNAMIAQQEQQEQEEQQEREKKEIEDKEQRQQAAEKKEPDPTVTARIEDAVNTSATVNAAVAAATTPLENRDRQPEEAKSGASTSQNVAVSVSNTNTATTDVTAEPQEEYLTRAAKLRSQLIDLERSVVEYDNATDTIIKQKRLQFKKLVNGKINTLAENVAKIRQVAQEVITAITNAKNEDAQYKVSAPNNKVYAIGKRYLVNLLSSKVIVRIQAEGFNGQRGDGFPLAHMLSIVAASVKDIVPVLSAHIFTVCPTAIPTLPSTTSTDSNTNSNNSDEDDFMIQLGMIRQKNGNFESFERFLSRTEGIVSLVANIMSSEPSNHLLFGGHVGAIKWLKRFLSILPPKPQSPLPLITAPVLDAFLTGAGHMMANIHAESFQQYLDVITNDICTRLDESSIGMPSATRLRKTIKNGMEGFRTTLPSKALPELYYRANGSGNHSSQSSSAPFGSGMAAPSPSPFGTGSISQVQPKPFFGSSNSTVASADSSVSSAFGSSGNPFGSNTDTSNSPFGNAASLTQNQSPFSAEAGSTAFGNGPSTMQSPFGGGTSTNNSFYVSPTTVSSSPFDSKTTGASTSFGTTSNFSSLPSLNSSGSQQQSPFSSNFGSVNSANPSPFQNNSTPFGSPAPATTPFGSSPAPSLFNSPAPAASPFGQPANNANSMPFGGGTHSSSQSPFASSNVGPTATPNTGIFGGGNPISSTFGSSTTPFGSSTVAPSPSPFSNNIQQQPFGGGNIYQSTASPFGGGTTSQQPTSSFAFGGQQSTPFGGGQQGGGVFGGNASSNKNDNRPPCKFFAKGTCRNGANCNFSHSTNTSGPYSNNYNNNAPFGGSNNNNPFGGPRR